MTKRKWSEAALIPVAQEAYIQEVSTRKTEKLSQKLGIENLSRSQVSEMTQGLDEQTEVFRNCTLKGEDYLVIWVDALYEKVRFSGRIVSLAIQIVCGVKENGQREILAMEPMLEEFSETYSLLFTQLKECSLSDVKLIVSDAQSGL